MDDREFFNKLAPTWDENEVRSTPERINHILDLAGIMKGQSVLDLGTGTGVLLPYIANRLGPHGKLTAVDYSSGMLDLAQKKFSDLVPKPEFLQLDIENENIYGEYDHIFLYCVYPHLHTPVDTLKWLRKVNLREKGNIIIAFPSDQDFINNIHKDRHSESDLLPSAENLASFLRENGLTADVLSSTSDAYVITIRK